MQEFTIFILATLLGYFAASRIGNFLKPENSGPAIFIGIVLVLLAALLPRDYWAYNQFEMLAQVLIALGLGLLIYHWTATFKPQDASSEYLPQIVYGVVASVLVVAGLFGPRILSLSDRITEFNTSFVQAKFYSSNTGRELASNRRVAIETTYTGVDLLSGLGDLIDDDQKLYDALQTETLARYGIAKPDFKSIKVGFNEHFAPISRCIKTHQNTLMLAPSSRDAFEPLFTSLYLRFIDQRELGDSVKSYEALGRSIINHLGEFSQKANSICGKQSAPSPWDSLDGKDKKKLVQFLKSEYFPLFIGYGFEFLSYHLGAEAVYENAIERHPSSFQHNIRLAYARTALQDASEFILPHLSKAISQLKSLNSHIKSLNNDGNKEVIDRLDFAVIYIKSFYVYVAAISLATDDDVASSDRKRSEVYAAELLKYSNDDSQYTLDRVKADFLKSAAFLNIVSELQTRNPSVSVLNEQIGHLDDAIDLLKEVQRTGMDLPAGDELRVRARISQKSIEEVRALMTYARLALDQ